jgi:hypothetical protein
MTALVVPLLRPLLRNIAYTDKLSETVDLG